MTLTAPLIFEIVEYDPVQIYEGEHVQVEEGFIRGNWRLLPERELTHGGRVWNQDIELESCHQLENVFLN